MSSRWSRSHRERNRSNPDAARTARGAKTGLLRRKASRNDRRFGAALPMTASHIPPDTEPCRARFVFRGEQFRRRVRQGAGAAVAQDDFRQVLAFHRATGAIAARADADHLAAAQEARQRTQRAALVV